MATKTTDKRKQKKIIERQDFALRELRQIAQLCTSIVREASQAISLHTWATYYAKAIKNAGIEESFQTKMREHADHEVYTSIMQELGRRGLQQAEYIAEIEKLTEPYSDYLEYQKSILDAECDLVTIRKIKADWCLNGAASNPVAALAVDHDLVDEPEKLLELIYGEGK